MAATLKALHRLGIERVIMGTRTTNKALRRVAEKLGAVVTAETELELPDGSRVPAVWYAHSVTGGQRPLR